MTVNLRSHMLGRLWGAASLALLATAAVAAPELDASSAALLQRVFQYELVLGETLDAQGAACLDDEFADEWLLPADTSTDVPARAAFRLRRAYEACLLSPAGPSRQGETIGTLRDVVRPMRVSLEKLLQARRSLDARKQLEACIKVAGGDAAIDDCLARSFATAPDAQARARWLGVAERVRTGGAMPR